MSKRRVFLMAQREWLENVRTKAFWIGILAFPIILVLVITIPTLLDKARAARQFAVIDHAGWVADAVTVRAAEQDLQRLFSIWLATGVPADAKVPGPLREIIEIIRSEQQYQAIPALARSLASDRDIQLDPSIGASLRQHRSTLQAWWRNLSPQEAGALDSSLAKARFVQVGQLNRDPVKLNQLLADDELFAYFVIGEDPLNESAGHRYVSVNLTDTDLQEWYGQLVNDVVGERRIASRNIDPAIAAWLRQPLQFTQTRIGEGGEEAEVSASDQIRQWAPTAFVYLLWIAVFSVSQMLLTNTIEEKSNRLMEVLLSSVSPLQLMLGKIIGIASVGLTMLMAWMGFLILAVYLLPLVLGAELKFDLSVIVADPVYIGSFLVYFVLGYLLFASLLVAIGSVCNTLKEAQNLMTPVILILMLPLLSMIPISKDPNGLLAQVLSYIPPMTPFVMMNRAAGPPSTWEYVSTSALLLASVLFVIWAAAKVFRIGILMTGKPPKVREIFRWIRAPIGLVPEKRGE